MSNAVVVLNWAQMKLGAEVGMMRSLSAIFNDREGRYGAETGASWQKDVTSAQAEMAVAKHFNLYWDGAIGDFGAKDVGGIIQVRSSEKPDHDLCLHPQDLDNDPFVSVLVEGRRFTLHGWAFAEQGKKKKFWRDGLKGRPAFWMPRSALSPIDSLWPVLRDRLWTSLH